MLLNRGPSWRQGSRPKPVNEAQDLSKQGSGDGDLCELKSNVAAMSHDLGADLDELFAQRGSRPRAALMSLTDHHRTSAIMARYVR